MIENGVFGANYSRRDFMKVITAATAVLGLPATMIPRVAEAADSVDKRPPVIWLHFQECTGCSESLLRASHPGIASLILDIISLEYHETLMPGSGPQAEDALASTIEKFKGQYILINEGAIPLKDGGIFCKVGGHTAKDSLAKAAEGAFAIINMGTCASLGGVQAADPNPTGAVSCASLVADKPNVINIPGCPPNPYNLMSTILYYLTFNALPTLDAENRPMFAYGRKIHDHCERRAHFDAGRFAKAFGDEGHTLGYCLYELGCKGPATYANCSTLRFNDNVTWPIGVGHPCVGCTERLAFNTKIADKVHVYDPTSPAWFPPAVAPAQGKPMGAIGAAVVGATLGVAAGYAIKAGKSLPKEHDDEKH